MRPSPRPPSDSTIPATTGPRLDRRALLLAAGLGAPTLALPPSAGVAATGRTSPGRTRAPRINNLPVLTTSGLYSWPWDYKVNRTRMAGLGCSTLRLAMDGMDDATWAAVLQDSYDAHITISGVDRGKFADEATWIAHYLDRVDSILTRYPFKWVEIWNEPNFGMWAGANAVQKQAAYGRLLVAAHRHIKVRYPGTGVVGFGAGGASAAAPGFIRGVFAAVPAATTSFDVLSLHPYISPAAPEGTMTEAWGSWTIEGQVNAIRKAGVTKPIWFTEMGWEISQADGGRYARPSTRVVSPALQAAYIVRAFVLAMRLGVTRVHHMYVVDTDGYNGGFFTGTGARPQAAAMAYQHRMLDRPTALTTRADGSRGVFAYEILTARGVVVVAWSDAGSRWVTSRQAQVTDLFGRRILPDANGVALSSSPVYIVNQTVGRRAR